MVRKHTQKPGVWFTPMRGSYLPVSAVGWLTYVPYLAYMVFTLVVGLKEAGSKALAVLFIIPNWVAASAVMTYLAAHKS